MRCCPGPSTWRGALDEVHRRRVLLCLTPVIKADVMITLPLDHQRLNFTFGRSRSRSWRWNNNYWSRRRHIRCRVISVGEWIAENDQPSSEVISRLSTEASTITEAAGVRPPEAASHLSSSQWYGCGQHQRDDHPLCHSFTKNPGEPGNRSHARHSVLLWRRDPASQEVSCGIGRRSGHKVCHRRSRNSLHPVGGRL